MVVERTAKKKEISTRYATKRKLPIHDMILGMSYSIVLGGQIRGVDILPDNTKTVIDHIMDENFTEIWKGKFCMILKVNIEDTTNIADKIKIFIYSEFYGNLIQTMDLRRLG